METQSDFKECCLEYFSLICPLVDNELTERRKCTCGSYFTVSHLDNKRLLIQTDTIQNSGILLKKKDSLDIQSYENLGHIFESVKTSRLS